jgi:hypothetical protein
MEGCYCFIRICVWGGGGVNNLNNSPEITYFMLLFPNISHNFVKINYILKNYRPHFSKRQAFFLFTTIA